MKRMTILALAVVAISLASCRKERTCTCKDASGNVTSKVTASKVKKHDFRLNSMCYGTKETYGNTTVETTCELK